LRGGSATGLASTDCSSALAFWWDSPLGDVPHSVRSEMPS
jgi:hypothetical protein